MPHGNLLHGLSAHTHGGGRNTTDIVTLDGPPLIVSVDDDTLWTCGPQGCVSQPLDLKSAEPDDAWYFDNGHWDEEDDDGEFGRPRLEVDPYNLVGHMTVTRLGGRPVVVTGGRRYDFSFGAEDDSSGGIVRVWDIDTGRMIGTIMTGHVLGVTALKTVPYAQERMVVSTCETGRTLVWDLAGCRKLAEIEGGYNGVMDAASIDGRPIAVTGGEDDFAQVWDLLTGQEIGEPLTGFHGPIGAIAVTAMDGRSVVLVSDDGGVHVRDLTSREAVGSPLKGYTGTVEVMGTAAVAGRTVVATSDDRNETRVWDLSRGEQLGEPIPERLETVTDAGGTPVAMTADGGNGIRLWDLTRY